MKKHTYCVLAALMITALASLVVPGLVFASPYERSAASQELSAFLLGPDGKSIVIPVEKVSKIASFSNSEERVSTYAVALSAGETELTKSQMDGSYSVKVYLTIVYREANNGASVLLTGVRGNWSILDKTVRVTNTSLRYGCDDIFILGRQAREIPSVLNNFSYTTGFQDYALVANGVMGANVRVTMQHGTTGSTWTLFVQNNYCNNHLSWFNTR